MSSRDTILWPIVRSARAATIAEGLCLALAAALLLCVAVLTDGLSPAAPGATLAIALGALAAGAAYLRPAWRSPIDLLRRADRVAGTKEMFATRFAAMRELSSNSVLSALFLETFPRDLVSPRDLRFGAFFRPAFLAPPLVAATLFVWLAFSPSSALREQIALGEAKRAIAAAARGLDADPGEAAAGIAATLREIERELALAHALSPRIVEMLSRLHAQTLEGDRETRILSPGLGKMAISPEDAQQVLAALEKAKIATSSNAGPGGPGEKVFTRSGNSQAGGEMEKLAPSSPSAMREPTTPPGERSEGQTRISYSYDVPHRFEPIVRRYFEGSSQ